MQFFNTRNLTKAVCLFTYSLIALVSVTYADDTEIFKVTPPANSGNANILIMLDTSGTMNQGIQYVKGYTPDVAIPSGFDNCHKNKIYAYTGSTPNLPKCNGSGSAPNTAQIEPSAFRCRDVAEFFIEIGSISARAKQFKTSNGGSTAKKWADLPNGSSTDPIECLDDQGIHGDVQVLTVTDGKVALDEVAMTTITTTDNYAANGDASNPWSTTEDTAVMWDENGFLTFYTGHFLNYAAYAKELDANNPDPDAPKLYVKTDGKTLAKTAMTNIVSDFRGFNLGIGRYQNTGNLKTAFILAPTVSLDDEANRIALQKYYIDPLGEKPGTLPNGITTTEDNKFLKGQPLASGQYEAYLYFKGEPPLGGGVGVSIPQPPLTEGANIIPQAICQSGDTSCTPGNYKSPITDICAKNYVLFLSAGGSSSDSDNDAAINNAELLIPGTTTPETLKTYKNNVACAHPQNNCLDDISEFMYTHDFSSVANGQADGEDVYQNVTTYAISINNLAPDLDEAATVGGGYFRKAENPGSIAAVLEGIISDILGQNTSFVSPSISVNNYNRLQHLNDLYFSLFAPTENALWDGNLKKYKIVEGVIRDSDITTGTPKGKNAVNQTTGAFEVNALSFWTNPSDASLATVDTTDGVKNSIGADGDVTVLGGFQSRLSETNRKVYTNAVSGDLSHSDNRIHESNTANITTAMLDIGTDTVLQERLLKWGRGIRFETSGTPPVETEYFGKEIGDLLHTSPVVVNYYNSNQNGPYDGDQTLYFGTNAGFIHGINNVPQNDLTTPIEAFTFAPKEMLPRFNDFYINQATTTKLYGMDGPITYWLDESNSQTPNFEVNSNERAFLYATQRRGGRNIYALEVQDRNNPKLTWSIKGGPTAQGGTPGFERLGQTWSTVKHATILDGSTNAGIEVVIFAGGYDDNQDAASSAPDANGSTALTTMGNSIYIANAKTGALIWSGSPDATLAKNTQYSEMLHPIPASVSVIDIDQDGYAEKMYAVDLAGQVWRFDFDPDTSSAGFSVTGGVMAKLNQENVSSTIDFTASKRFYSGPSVSFLSDANTNFLTIGIGSGYRAHPLDEKINDKFYVLKDYYPYGPPTDSNGIVDYLMNMVYDDSDATTPVQLNKITPTSNPGPGTHGWAFDFSETGEKVINPAIAIDGKVFFTSYLPESNAPLSGATNCAPNAFLGKSRLYSIFIKTGGPGFTEYVPDSDPDDGIDDSHTTAVYYEEVTAPGASGGPRAIFTPTIGANPDCASQSDLLVLVGTDVFDPGICTAPVRTYWQRVE